MGYGSSVARREAIRIFSGIQSFFISYIIYHYAYLIMVFSELPKCLKDFFIGFPPGEDYFAAAGVLLLRCVLFQKSADSPHHKKAEDKLAQH